MKRFSYATIIAILATAAFGVAARADVAVMDNDKTIDVDCAKDPNVALLGNHLTLTTKGVCSRIMVSGNDATVTASASVVSITGNHNTIALDAADDISVTGNDNSVSVNKPIKAKSPRISNPGNRNKIKRGK
jgi:catabolite regulation protein CreA